MVVRFPSLVHGRKMLAAGALAAIAVVMAIPAQAHAASTGADSGPAGSAISEPMPAGGQQSAPARPAKPGAAKLCSGHGDEYGNWVNADANASGIARIELRDCLPVTTCHGDICSITHDAGWALHAYGKCSPANCDWGWSASEFRTSSGQVHGYYDQGFAKRHVYAKMSAYRPGQLWVHWRTDFTDPARADYDVDEWFVHG